MSYACCEETRFAALGCLFTSESNSRIKKLFIFVILTFILPLVENFSLKRKEPLVSRTLRPDQSGNPLCKNSAKMSTGTECIAR